MQQSRRNTFSDQDRPRRELRLFAGRPTDVTAHIRSRAYELYQVRGCAPGRDLEDWFTAETEVMRAKLG